MRASLLILALLLAGCSAPEASEETPVAEAAAAIPLSPETPVAPSAPTSTASGSPCVHDPCSRVAAEGWHVEPAVAISPSDALRVIVADFGTDGSHTGSWLYLSLSQDGGASWDSRRAPPAPAPTALAPTPAGTPVSTMAVVADPIAAWPTPDVVIVIALVGDTVHTEDWDHARPLHIVQWRSTDAGATWSDGEIIAAAEGFRGSVGGTTIHARWYDKPALAFDAATGEIHVLFHRILLLPNGLWVVETLAIDSADAGATWSRPRVVPELEGLYGASLVAHDDVMLATIRNPNYRVYRSEDGGATWDAVADFGEGRPGTGAFQAAPIALWSAAEGVVHAALLRSDGPANERLFLHLSQDGGRTWSEGTLILPENATERRNPVLAVDHVSGLGFAGSYHAEGAPERLATWVVPLTRGIPGTPARIDGGASGTNVFEYNGAAAARGVAYFAFASTHESAAPLHVAALHLR